MASEKAKIAETAVPSRLTGPYTSLRVRKSFSDSKTCTSFSVGARFTILNLIRMREIYKRAGCRKLGLLY